MSGTDQKSPRGGLREGLKRGTRAFGQATSALRGDPDFLVIGAKRGGSTSFYYDLLSHPGVMQLFPPAVPVVKPDPTKGIHYFDSNYVRGDGWYRSHLPTRAWKAARARQLGYHPVVGEASPYYLFHPDAARRAAALVPQAKIILVLRDPVERTYSHWKERRRSHAEELDFLEALAAEPGRLAGERDRILADPAYLSYPWEQQSYATQSRYADALEPWVRYFGLDRMLILASEDYFATPDVVLARAHEFLGLPPLAQSTGQVRNSAQGAPLGDDVLADLRARFEEPNRRLRELTGLTFPWA